MTAPPRFTAMIISGCSIRGTTYCMPKMVRYGVRDHWFGWEPCNEGVILNARLAG